MAPASLISATTTLLRQSVFVSPSDRFRGGLSREATWGLARFRMLMHRNEKWLFPVAVWCVLLLHSIAARSQQLSIQHEDGKPTILLRADLEALPHVKLKASAHDVSATFEGVTLKSVLEKAGVGFGETLRGKRLASCLVAEAAEGYRVVIALPEMDPAFTDKQIVLAFLKDGKPLDEKEGPYRIVIPDEKRPARWIRQLTVLKIVNVK